MKCKQCGEFVFNEVHNCTGDLVSVGFADMGEMCSMVARVDLTKHLAAFEKWKAEDGTKAGLKKLLPEEVDE